MIRLLHGDCRDVLRTLPAASVQCCVTSPPYYGLRDYGVAGQIGLEPSPSEYVAQLVAVFREVWRVLRYDGTVWLNLGDSYAASGAKRLGRNDAERDFTGGGGNKLGSGNPGSQGYRILDYDAKPKDLLGIPWRVAFALQDAGWYLRCDIVWAKRNCMPESVRDRPTRAHEYIFLLTKSERYYYDAVAIEEESEASLESKARYKYGRYEGSGKAKRFDRSGKPDFLTQNGNDYGVSTGKRNKRSVWWMATQPFAEAHFATFPPELPETCIKAGTSERGCCPICGAAWVRQVESPRVPSDLRNRDGGAKMDFHTRQTGSGQKMQDWRDANPAQTTGWCPSCSCPSHDPRPCTVLDPFFGAGTTGLVADRLGRNCIGIELNPTYSAITERRIVKDAGMFADIAS